MIKRIGAGGIVLIILSACGGEKEVGEKFFDFDGLIDRQVALLTENRLQLEKKARLGTQQSDTTYRPSRDSWERELMIFRQLEVINRPTFRKAYVIRDPLPDSRSNLKIRDYASDVSPAPSVKFYYQQEFARLRRIEATVQENNSIYSSRRLLQMDFEERSGKLFLVHYAVRGFQKMPLSDTVLFEVNTVVR